MRNTYHQRFHSDTNHTAPCLLNIDQSINRSINQAKNIDVKYRNKMRQRLQYKILSSWAMSTTYIDPCTAYRSKRCSRTSIRVVKLKRNFIKKPVFVVSVNIPIQKHTFQCHYKDHPNVGFTKLNWKNETTTTTTKIDDTCPETMHLPFAPHFPAPPPQITVPSYA